MTYTGAGHETLFHYKAADGTCDNIKGGGIALGMIPDNEKLTKEEALDLQEGDFIVLYTDGIVEARNENGEMYSIDMFLKLVEKEAPKANTAEELFTALSTQVLKYLGDFIQEDDMTLLVIKKGPAPTSGAKESTEWNTEEST
jgi:sigma-B regulation protein RsbU (phosphoserine phosphatase)